MNTDQQGKVTSGLASLAAGLNPLKSTTFLLALALMAVAGLNWLRQSGDPQPSFPLYGTIAVSYAGGFLLGRLLWRVLKTAAIVAALALGGLALLNRVHVDTSKAKDAAEQSSTWVRNEAGRAKHYLVQFLPSGGAAGLGVFAGGRRGRRGGNETRTRNRESET
jgi:hypothetical protein